MIKLKSYKLFESTRRKDDQRDNIKLEIKDILIDMIDDGYGININFDDSNKYINLFMNDKSSKYVLIKRDMSKYIDDITRLKDYMERLGYTWVVGDIKKLINDYEFTLGEQKPFEEQIELMKTTKLGSLLIYFQIN